MENVEIVKTELKMLEEIASDIRSEFPAPAFYTAEYFILSATYRIINLTKSILLLTENPDLAGTSEPLLRTAFELAINCEWLFSNKARLPERLKNYFDAPTNSEDDAYWFGEKWTDSSLKDRMEQLGFGVSGKDHKDYYSFVVLPMHDYCHNNIMSLPNPPEFKEALSSKAILTVLAQALSHMLKAIDVAFDDKYPQHKEALKLVKTIKPTTQDMLKIKD